MGCTQLKEAGFDVKMLDCPTEGKSSLSLHDFDSCDVVVMEARTPLIGDTYRWADVIRALGIKVILYGDHATAFPEEAKGHCDVVVKSGDYDIGVAEACRLISEGFAISSIEPIENNLNIIPICDRELVDWRKYYEAWRHRDTFLWTMSGRGCHYNCTFCAWAEVFWNNKLRMRSPANVAEEYAMLHKRYGDCEILDDVDIFPQGWGWQFGLTLQNMGFVEEQILWAVQTHPNEIRDRTAWEVMRKSGLCTVKLGIESLNQKTLNNLRKGTTVKQIEHAIKTLKASEIMIHANMMVGFPWETREDALRTVKMIKKLDPNQAQFSLVIPYPWTDLYKEAQEKGWLVPNARMDATFPMMTMQGMSNKEVADLYEQCWHDFYFAPLYVTKKVLKAVAHVFIDFNFVDLRQLWRGYKSVKHGHMRSMEVES